MNIYSVPYTKFQLVEKSACTYKVKLLMFFFCYRASELFFQYKFS